VTSWSEFAAAEPAFAQRALERFTVRKHSTLATLHTNYSGLLPIMDRRERVLDRF
jgi:hypothetical protein